MDRLKLGIATLPTEGHFSVKVLEHNARIFADGQRNEVKFIRPQL